MGLTNLVAAAADGTSLSITGSSGLISVGGPVLATISPRAATLSASQSQQFTATVTGGPGNTAVAWSLDPNVGTIINGLYTAPATITSQQTVSITATSVADSSKSATSTVTLRASVAMAVSISPAAATISAGQSQTFEAMVIGGRGNDMFTWSLDPSVGTISSRGVYVAPSDIPVQQTVTVTATSAADPSKSASIPLTLLRGSVVLQILGSPLEVSGITNDSIVTPTLSPGGLLGRLVVKGSGSVNFSPHDDRDGVFFLRCCGNTNNAYYKFTGQTIGDTFGADQGEISFSLTSRYSFLERQANAPQPRYAFDARDGNGNHVFYFLTQISSGHLVFTYRVAGANGYYYVPLGTEDALFGSGTMLKVNLIWDNSKVALNLNGQVVDVRPRGTAAAAWTSTSQFDLGAYEYLTFGGFNVSDDEIAHFNLISHALKGISVTPSNVSVLSGQAQQFTAFVTGSASDAAVTWSLSPNVGTITTAGFYTAPADISSQQTITATATSVEDQTKSAKATITLLPPVAVVLSPTNSQLPAGATQHFTAVVTGGTGNSAVIWSLDPNLGTVSNGVYTAPARITSQQTVTVTATSADDQTKSATATITLLPPVAVVLSPTNSQLSAGATQHFTAVVTGGTGNRAVIWSLFPNVGTISSTGLYRAPADISFQQTITITATSAEDASSSAVASIMLTPGSVLLQILGNPSELSGVTNSSNVAPTINVAGVNGAVIVSGSGSVNFSPDDEGNGVFFLKCCNNTNNAYYKFTGQSLRDIFALDQGQINFFLKSQLSFAQRQTQGMRYAFDVRDGDGKHLFYFVTQVFSGRLVFTYVAVGTGGYYYVPLGAEDTLFGNGMTLNVMIQWDATKVALSLNGRTVDSKPRAFTTANWTSNSHFYLGAYEYLTFGCFNVSDDIIGRFTVLR